VVSVIFTAGLKKKHRKHYSNDAKEIVRNVYKNVLELGCKAVGKETARLTGQRNHRFKNLEPKPGNLERKKKGIKR
jgi:hypothetical protein